MEVLPSPTDRREAGNIPVYRHKRRMELCGGRLAAKCGRRGATRVSPLGPLQLCGFATQVRWVHDAGWLSGFAAKPAPLAS